MNNLVECIHEKMMTNTLLLIENVLAQKDRVSVFFTNEFPNE